MIILDKLSEYLKKSDADVITLSFSEIESILESELPTEAKQTAKWWWNIKDSKKAKSWLNYGYYTYDSKNIPSRGNVCFKRTVQKPELKRGFSRIWYFLTDKDAELHQKVMAVLEISVMPLVTILALIVAILNFNATTFPEKSQDQIKKEFESLVFEGEYAFKNKAFLEAASYYHQASLIAYDTHSEAYSLHGEGSCYMLYGIAESDKYYLKRTLMIFENIVNTPEYENTKGYQEAIIDLCSLYGILGYDWQDEKWRSAVEQLENMFNFDNIEKIPDEDMSTLISVATSLSLYYKAMLSSDFNIFLLDEDTQQKTIYYLKAANQLEMKYNEHHGVKIYDEALLISTYNMTHYVMTNALFNPKDNNLEILEEARTLCHDAISTFDLEANNMLQLDMYIKLKTNIGKSYYFSSFASESPSKEDYLLKAYQELIPLFNWDSYEVNESLMYTSCYVLGTGLCTENDIQMILNRLSSHLQTVQENNDISTQIRIELQGLEICSYILLYYDYETNNSNVQKLGQQLWTDLYTVLYDFLDSSQKAELEEYSEEYSEEFGI